MKISLLELAFFSFIASTLLAIGVYVYTGYKIEQEINEKAVALQANPLPTPATVLTQAGKDGVNAIRTAYQNKVKDEEERKQREAELAEAQMQAEAAKNLERQRNHPKKADLLAFGFTEVEQQKVSEIQSKVGFYISNTEANPETCIVTYTNNKEELPCTEVGPAIDLAYRNHVHNDLVFKYEDLPPEYLQKVETMRAHHTFNVLKNDNKCTVEIKKNDKSVNANLEHDCADLKKIIDRYYPILEGN